LPTNVLLKLGVTIWRSVKDRAAYNMIKSALERGAGDKLMKQLAAILEQR
jgi:cysteine synthase